MKITLCGSLDFSHEMGDIARQLEILGHITRIPYNAERVLSQEITLENIIHAKEDGTRMVKLSIEHDAIRRHYRKIAEADAILVVNLEKKWIPGYIGGNTFLEVGFAHVLDRKIFLLHEIPDMPYTTEIRAMQPTVIAGDLERIVSE